VESISRGIIRRNRKLKALNRNELGIVDPSAGLRVLVLLKVIIDILSPEFASDSAVSRQGLRTPLDRIDLHLEVPSVPYRELSGISEVESSQRILERVVKVRKIQEERFSRTKIFNNAGMNSRHLKKDCAIDAESGVLLERAMDDRFGLSARAHARILKISRTIADLEGVPDIQISHVAEAIQYRTLDRRIQVS